MNKRRKIILTFLVLAVVAGGIYYALTHVPREIVLTGIVTTDEVIIAPQIQGRLQNLFVQQGDAVTNGELLATLQPETEQADLQFYASSQQQAVAQVAQAEADLENARLNFERIANLYTNGTESVQTYDAARTTLDSATARINSLNQQTQAAAAQKEKAAVQLSYTQIFAPTNGIVDTRAALQSEVVNPGQAIVTLINQDDLWVRADVEETYITKIKVGDQLRVKLPSGEMREGTVFYRGIDADYATQRDVNRTKRDIKTFEIRLRCDNSDRALAVGMTAYVELPLK